MVQLELKSYSTTFRPKVNIINVHETHHIPIVLWQCYTWNDFHASTLKCAKMCTPSRMDVQSPFATTAIQFCWVSAGCVLKLLNLWRYKTRKNKFCLFATAALHRLIACRLRGRLLTSRGLPYCSIIFSLWDDNLGREHSRNDFYFQNHLNTLFKHMVKIIN